MTSAKGINWMVETNSTIDTGGGTYVTGSVHTDGGDFVGRDKIAIVYPTNVGICFTQSRAYARHRSPRRRTRRERDSADHHRYGQVVAMNYNGFGIATDWSSVNNNNKWDSPRKCDGFKQSRIHFVH